MVKYLYICAAGHSGSTLLDLLLGSHSRISSLGEIDHLSKNIALNSTCSCGQKIRSCEFWRSVIARLASDLDIDILTTPYALHLGYPRASTLIDHNHQTRAYLFRRRLILGLYYLRLRFGAIVPRLATAPVERAIENNIRVFDVVRDILDIDTVVDSSKSYLKALALYSRDPEHVRILLLSRDGRGVLWSRLKRGVSRSDGLEEWKNQYARAIPLFKRHVDDNHLIHVTYEALTSDPAKEIARICKFSEQDFEPRMLNFRSTTHHIANGNDMRLSESTQISPDTAWRDKLSDDDLKYFERIAGTVNRQLGYDS